MSNRISPPCGCGCGGVAGCIGGRPPDPCLGQQYTNYMWDGRSWTCMVALPDAPRDGVMYGRLNGVWSPALSANGGEVLALTVDGQLVAGSLQVNNGANIAGGLNVTGGETVDDLNVTNNLAVVGSATITGGSFVVDNTGSGGAIEAHDTGYGDAYCLQVYSELTGFLIGFWYGGGANTTYPTAQVVGSIQYNFSTGVTLFNSSSDASLKDDEGAPNAKDIGSMIDELEPKKFRWKGERGGKDETHLGLMAQDVNRVFPDAVSPGHFDKKRNAQIPWMVDYSKLVPLLLAEVKELRKRLAKVEGHRHG